MQTIPVSALQNPEDVSELCRKTVEPVRVEVDGRNDLVVMSPEVYRLSLIHIYADDLLRFINAVEDQIILMQDVAKVKATQNAVFR